MNPSLSTAFFGFFGGEQPDSQLANRQHSTQESMLEEWTENRSYQGLANSPGNRANSRQTSFQNHPAKKEADPNASSKKAASDLFPVGQQLDVIA